MPAGEIVGRVAVLTRFPVKSMAGEPADVLDLRWTGIAGDRRFAFYHVANHTGFPWTTGRDVPALVRHVARLRDPAQPARSAVDVTLPSGDTLSIDDPALAARLSDAAGGEVRLIQSGRGAFDAMPISIASTATLTALDAAHGQALDRRRFRFNIVIDSDQRDLAWRGHQLRFGDADDAPALLVTDGIPRCAMVTIDPGTAARDTSVLRTIAQTFSNQLGVYAAPATLGALRVSDAVRLIR